MNTGWRRTLRSAVATGTAAALLTSLVTPAAAAPVPLSEAQLTAALFGAAVRVKDSGFDYEKTAIGSAELVDWRAKNPGATAAEAADHAAKITKSMTDNFSHADSRLPGNEKQSRLIEIIQDTPGAVFTGPQITNLMAVLTARDLAPGTVNLHIGQRLSGAQQRFGLDMHYSLVSGELWTAVRDKALTDQVLNAAWRGEFGKPTAKHPDGLFPNWSLGDFKKFGVLKDLVDIDAILNAAKAGETQLYDELRKQFMKMRDKLWDENDKTYKKINELANSLGLPGAQNGGVPKEAVDAALKAEKERQEVLDGIKGGFDVVVGIAKMLHPGFAKHLKAFGESAFQFAGAVSELGTALVTLASATGFGASTLGAVGAAVGAVIGIIQVFSGLLSGSDQTAEVQLAMMKEIRHGFLTMQIYMEKMYETMNKRFDRIEQGLDTIYKSMMENFGTVLLELDKIDKKLDVVHDNVLRLMSSMQGFHLHLLQIGTDHERDDFFKTADVHTDYQHVNKIPLEYSTGEASFTKAAATYNHAATMVSRYASLVFTNPNEHNLDLALKNGPAGAIDYLLGRANLPRSTEVVPNADFWAEAARAYAILSMQNPAHAMKETEGTGSARIKSMLLNADQIQQAAARISAPQADPNKATNPTFQNRLADYENKVKAFIDDLRTMQYRPEVMPPNRQFKLWENYSQQVDMTGKLPAPPDTIPGCGGEPSIQRPDFMTTTNLPKPLLFGLYLTGDSRPEGRWQYLPCWFNARWDEEPYNGVDSWKKITSGPHKGEIEYTMARYAPHRADFREQVKNTSGPFGAYFTGQITTANRHIRLCLWKSIGVEDYNTPATCPDRGDAAEQMSGSFGLPKVTMRDEMTGTNFVDGLLNDRRVVYFNLIASQFQRPDGMQSALNLRDSARLLEAYTRIGFPRSLEADDQMQALLLGANSVANAGAIYAEEARTFRIGGYGKNNTYLDKEGPQLCELIWLTGNDPVASCVRDSLLGRAKRLAERYEIHSRNIRSGQLKEELPLVAEAARNLRIIDKYYRARFTTG
ncbi:hypothetical protein LWC34_24780 [Kibdelosporangium philippinense]|uniref:Uncharacterized protein n=1 Tax=Kibdelosporangium philippinense TaxID=211113 RepID=A0ABS8ZDV6_9PSEU|nr:hypothetical protein [Kibdelosporangium philippinense]MCE7006023.1 hypothetical protein [Kibdelosporangium philippinense]